jgi:BirA family biotin operon repressor/biotin-[acetyl-CoA-carboxylase] ligase
MLAMNSSLCAERITRLARTAANDMAFEVVAETGSTNADLVARLASLPRPVLRVAERQIAGRATSMFTHISAPCISHG